MSSSVNMQEFVAGFILEAEEHLHSVNRNFVTVSEALKAGRPEPKAVRELFRSFHTIKGLASMVEAESIAEIAHEMEGILRNADRAAGRLSERALDLLLEATRVIEDRIKSIPKAGVSGLAKAPPRLIEELALIQGSEMSNRKAIPHQALVLPDEILKSLAPSDREQALQGLSSRRKLFLIDFEPSPQNSSVGLNITSVRDRIAKFAELVKVVPHSSQTAPTGIAFFLLILTDVGIPDIVSKSGLALDSIREVAIEKIQSEIVEIDEQLPESDEAFSATPDNDNSSVRVSVRKLDEVMERLSDLIVTRSKLSKTVTKLLGQGVDTRELTALVSENGRQLKRLRNAITQARMVSLSELFQRIPLVVRGLTKDPSKAVDVFIQAGSAEVDKAVADRIFPAIVHIIRNSVDHAIENKEDRKRAGKDETGVVTISCDDSSGTTLTITITDDGHGIDRAAVAKKSGQPLAKTDDELLKQICKPGLSTREDVTRTSGRGMGMDIVRKTIELLGGTMRLSTQEGKGTKFIVRVPVSITIIDVLSFVSGGQVFVAPVAMIQEIVEVDPAQLSKSPPVLKGGLQPQLFSRRGEAIPYLVLESVLNNRPDKKIPTTALVVHQHNGFVAFGVDRMLGQQEVVVRPIDDKLIRAKGMSGAADLGDGHPTLVLDLISLTESFGHSVEVNV